jgi:hypothetical protein
MNERIAERIRLEFGVAPEAVIAFLGPPHIPSGRSAPYGIAGEPAPDSRIHGIIVEIEQTPQITAEGFAGWTFEFAHPTSLRAYGYTVGSRFGIERRASRPSELGYSPTDLRRHFAAARASLVRPPRPLSREFREALVRLAEQWERAGRDRSAAELRALLG